MAYRGSLAVLRMGPDGDETKAYEVTAEDNGCSVVTINELRPARVVPGGGPTVVRETAEYGDLRGSFELDANESTAPEFAATSGQRKWFFWYPEGNATGQPKETFQAYISVVVNVPAEDAIRFGVTLDGDSAISRGIAA